MCIIRFMVYRERKGTDNLHINFSLNYRNLKQNDSDYLYGSNRQVNFGFRRLRRWTPARERKLE